MYLINHRKGYIFILELFSIQISVTSMSVQVVNYFRLCVADLPTFYSTQTCGTGFAFTCQTQGAITNRVHTDIHHVASHRREPTNINFMHDDLVDWKT